MNKLNRTDRDSIECWESIPIGLLHVGKKIDLFVSCWVNERRRQIHDTILKQASPERLGGVTQSEWVRSEFQSSNHDIDGHGFDGCFDRRIGRRPSLPPLLRRHDPRLLLLANRSESTRKAHLRRSFRRPPLLPLLRLLLKSPLPHPDDDRIRFHGDVSTQVWNHHFLPRLRLSHRLVMCFFIW